MRDNAYKSNKKFEMLLYITLKDIVTTSFLPTIVLQIKNNEYIMVGGDKKNTADKTNTTERVKKMIEELRRT